MSEIKPKMVDGEALCVCSCPINKWTYGKEPASCVRETGAPCVPYYRAHIKRLIRIADDLQQGLMLESHDRAFLHATCAQTPDPSTKGGSDG